MADRFLLGLDAGTSSAKALIIKASGRPVAFASKELRYFVPEGLSPLAREFDPEAFCGGILSLIQACLKKGGLKLKDIAGIGLTSQREGLVFLDKNGKEIYAGPNLDLRAVFEGGEIDEASAQEVYRVTGHLPSFFFGPAKLKWFQAHSPQVYEATRTALPIAAWMANRLTGELACEPSLACEAGFLDISSFRWCISLMEELGLKSDIFPRLVPAGYCIGRTTSLSGLAPGTPVAIAGADTQCALLSLGAADEGDVGIVAGWSATVQKVMGRPQLDPKGRIWTGVHVVPKRWILESSLGDGGNSYRWLRDLLFSGGAKGFTEMEREAAQVPPGSEGTQSFLGVSVMDMTRLGMRRGGVMFPIPITFSGLGRGHLVRATLESMVFGIKANLGQLFEVGGIASKQVYLGGGMIQTSLFPQMVADVLGQEVRVAPVPWSSTLGAALAAGVAAGVYGNLMEAAEVGRRSALLFKPDPSQSLEYQAHYQAWLQATQELESRIS